MEQKVIEDVWISTILPKPGFATTGPGTLVAVEACDGMGMFLLQRDAEENRLRDEQDRGNVLLGLVDHVPLEKLYAVAAVLTERTRSASPN
jgi:hypothetical protein